MREPNWVITVRAQLKCLKQLKDYKENELYKSLSKELIDWELQNKELKV